jgi:hypothetical protein
MVQNSSKPNVAMHTCNSSIQEAGIGGLEFKTSLCYIVKPCLKKGKGVTQTFIKP